MLVGYICFRSTVAVFKLTEGLRCMCLMILCLLLRWKEKGTRRGSMGGGGLGLMVVVLWMRLWMESIWLRSCLCVGLMIIFIVIL